MIGVIDLPDRSLRFCMSVHQMSRSLGRSVGRLGRARLTFPHACSNFVLFWSLRRRLEEVH